MKDLIEISEARTPSYRVKGDFELNQESINFLKLKAVESGLCVARFVLHASDESLLHQMIILKLKNYEEKWIRHPSNMPKSFYFIEGAGELVYKDSHQIKISQKFFHQAISSAWHKLEIHSEYLLYMESMLGPIKNCKSDYLNGQ